MPFKIEFQLAAGKHYLDGAKKESHFIIVDDDLNPCELDNIAPLEKLMAQRVGCSTRDIYHWWYNEVEVPEMLDPADIVPIDTFDKRLVGAVVHCGTEIGVTGLVIAVKPSLQALAVKSFGEESFIFPFNEVHGIVKHEAFK